MLLGKRQILRSNIFFPEGLIFRCDFSMAIAYSPRRDENIVIVIIARPRSQNRRALTQQKDDDPLILLYFQFRFTDNVYFNIGNFQYQLSSLVILEEIVTMNITRKEHEQGGDGGTSGSVESAMKQSCSYYINRCQARACSNMEMIRARTLPKAIKISWISQRKAQTTYTREIDSFSLEQ